MRKGSGREAGMSLLWSLWALTFSVQQPCDPQALGDLERLLQVLPVTLDLHPLHVHQIWPVRHAPESHQHQVARSGHPGWALLP